MAATPRGPKLKTLAIRSSVLFLGSWIAPPHAFVLKTRLAWQIHRDRSLRREGRPMQRHRSRPAPLHLSRRFGERADDVGLNFLLAWNCGLLATPAPEAHGGGARYRAARNY